MNRKLRLRSALAILWAAILLASAGAAQEPHPHEYAPIETVDLGSGKSELKRAFEDVLDDFSGVTREGEPVELSRLLEEKRVVLLTYLAEWCANCRYEAPILAELYGRYRDRGFEIVARSEYSHRDEVERFIREFGVEHPVILGSPNPDPDDEDAVRTVTTHYRFRKALDDERKWGTPLNILILGGDLDSIRVVTGEFEPGALEELLARELGEPEATS